MGHIQTFSTCSTYETHEEVEESFDEEEKVSAARIIFRLMFSFFPHYLPERKIAKCLFLALQDKEEAAPFTRRCHHVGMELIIVLAT